MESPPPTSMTCVSVPSHPGSIGDARRLIQSYAGEILQQGCFEGLALELDQLVQIYAPPSGDLYIAYVGDQPVGCCGFKPCGDTNHTNACEMKRLYVSPAFRGMGLGHHLVHTVMEASRTSGYSCMLIDTLDEMKAARSLYSTMGFYSIAPYAQSTLAGAHHLRVDL